MFISLSIVFSGFGNLTPNTRLGQGMTIIFCLIGIPLTMFNLAGSAGELMMCGICFIVTKTEVCLLNNDPPKNENGKVSFCAVSLMIALLLLASTCSVFMERWSSMESVYAWFTLSQPLALATTFTWTHLQGRPLVERFQVIGWCCTALFPLSRISRVLVLFPVFWAALLTRWRMLGISVIGVQNSSKIRLRFC